MIFTSKKILLIIFLSNGITLTNFCMQTDEMPRAFIKQNEIFNPFQLIEKDDQIALTRMATQLYKLGLNIMEVTTEAHGDTPLHYAVRHQRMRCLRSLLSMPCVKEKMCLVNSNFETVFMLAEKSNSDEINRMFQSLKVLEQRAYHGISNLELK